MKGYIYLFRRVKDNSPCYVGQHNGKNKYYFTNSSILTQQLDLKGEIKFWKYYKREIIHQNISSYAKLNSLEKKYVKQHNTYIGSNPKKGYNLTKGGDNSDSMTNHPNKKNIIERQKKTRKKTLSDNPDIMKNTVKKRLKTFKENPCIVQGIKENLKLFYTNNSEVKIEAEKKRKKTRDRHPEIKIQATIKLKQTFTEKPLLTCPHCGHKSNRVNIMKGFHFGNCNPIIQLTLDNNFVAIFTHLSEANSYTGIAINGINNVCNGKKNYKTAGGFKWMFEKDYLKGVVQK